MTPAKAFQRPKPPAFLRPPVPNLPLHSAARSTRLCPLFMRGPSAPPPSYTRIDSNPFNRFFTQIFLRKLLLELGHNPDPSATGYPAVIQTVTALARRDRHNPSHLRAASKRVLDSLFPAWLPPAFRRLFSKPLPHFAAWINAVVTVAVTQWLMGPSRLADDGATVEIERCRYLEETGCVGICVHSCKTATESFFQERMGLDLAIEPNLDDYSCKFRFGQTPQSWSEDPMFRESCFPTCPMSTSPQGRVCNSVDPDA